MLVFLFVFSWAGFHPLMLSDDTSLVAAEGSISDDVHGDGRIDVCDAILALRGIVGLADESMAARADTNGDGVTDVDDAVFILRRVANNQEVFYSEPKGEIDGASVQTTTMVIERMIGEVGDEIDVTFSVTDPIDIAGFQIKVHYDPGSLKYVKYLHNMKLYNPQTGEEERSGNTEINPQYDDGTIAIAWAYSKNIHKTGNLLTLTFEVIGSPSDVRMWIDEDDGHNKFTCLDENAACYSIALTYEYGISDPAQDPELDPNHDSDPDLDPITYGDLSGDGEVKVDDAISLLRYVVGLEEFSPEEIKAADVNGDGKVDVQDAILILRHIVGLIDKFPAEEL